jgi:ADP-ribosyl-[dinitrogen reductase] hydrolase
LLIELAIGDAYGAAFEFVAPSDVHFSNDLRGYYQHPIHLSIQPGQYTDDTQMTIAVVEALLESPEPTPLQWANHFVACFKRDPRQGYAHRFYDFLLEVTCGQEFLDRIAPYSDKSGAAMRSIPLGYLPDIAAVKKATTAQAMVTHNTPDGIQSALAVALSAYYLRRSLGQLCDLNAFLRAEIGGNWTQWNGYVGSQGLESVSAAITALVQNRSTSSLLQQSINFQGDVDTIAAIALGLASLSGEYKADLPEILYQRLEDEAYGRRYLESLETQLAKISLA